jgi:succinyl-diaminopimelate desuccinylase
MLDPRHHDRLCRFVEDHRDHQIAFLQRIVQIPSDTPPGDNAPAAECAAQLLAELGFPVERHPVPAAVLADYGMRSVTNLVVRQRFGDGNGPTIALNAHGDVVPPGDGWTRDPYAGTIEDGRMYARGVAVSKSDIASYSYALAALRALADEGAPLRGSVELHFTYDEEFGGLAGPGFLLGQRIVAPDFVIGAGFGYQVVTAHNGCLQFEVTVHGQAAHGSIPHTGHDAFQAGVAILQALYAQIPGFAARRSAIAGIESPTLVVGLIQGGINTNVVPDRLVLRFDRRLIPEENLDEVEAGLRRLIADAVADRAGIRVEVRRLLRAAALKPSQAQRPLVEALQHHGARVIGETIPAVGVPLYTDARLYGEAGCAVVLYGAGPRTVTESNAKRADENLCLEDLRKATQVVACAVGDLLVGRDGDRRPTRAADLGMSGIHRPSGLNPMTARRRGFVDLRGSR